MADYIDGVLQFVVCYIYEDGKLSRGWCEDKEGNPAYELVVKKGRIAEKQYYTTDGEYSHSLLYEYDKHGNLTQEQFSVDGEVSPSETYTYKAVEVDADRAEQLLKQQEQFIWLLSNYVGL